MMVVVVVLVSVWRFTTRRKDDAQLILRGREQQSIGSVAPPDGDGQFIKTGKGETGDWRLQTGELLAKASTLHHPRRPFSTVVPQIKNARRRCRSDGGAPAWPAPPSLELVAANAVRSTRTRGMADAWGMGGAAALLSNPYLQPPQATTVGC